MIEIQKYFYGNWDKILGIIIAYFSLVLPIFRYLKDKRKDDRNKRFENYHKLLDDLLGGQPNSQVKIDRQIAILFELRNFSDYYPVTLRILDNLKNTWKEIPLLVTEINLTEKYINSSFLDKLFFQK